LTITQDGCSHGKAMRPTTVVAAISSGLLTFHLADQRDRTAEAEAAEPQEVADELADPAFRNDCCRRH
jgi:hypothetical protein